MAQYGNEVVYRAKVRVRRDEGFTRSAWLPAADEPVIFGVHSEIAKHYGANEDEVAPRPTTLDYLVAAAAG